MNVMQGNALPLGEALRGINAQHIRPCLQEGWHPLRIVPGIDARPHDIALAGVQQLKLVFLVVRIVLAEDHVAQALLLINQGQHVQLMLPDHVIGLGKGRGICIRIDEILELRHKGARLGIKTHAGQTVITAGHDAQELARRRAVLRHRHGGMARPGKKLQNLPQGRAGLDIGVTVDKALDTGHHSRFFLNALGTVDEGNTALLGQGNGHGIIGHGLHDGRCHGNVHGDFRLLALPELHQRRFQGHIRRNALVRRIARHQQIFPESMRWFLEVECQPNPFFLNICS